MVLKKTLIWSSLDSVVPQLVSFVFTIIISRILTPSDYGLIGALSFFFAFAQLFSDIGMSQALIQKKEISDDNIKSVFIINVILGLIIAIILFLISDLVANFFNKEILADILKFFSIGYFFSSFGIVNFTLFQRNLKFKKIFIVSLVNTFVSSLVSLILAINGFGVWSLVYGTLVGIFFRVLTIWILREYNLIGKFSYGSLKEIFSFSGNILLVGIFTSFVDNLYSLLIGKFYKTSELGLYNRSMQLQMLPVNMITNIIGKVAFPLFSRNQDNINYLKIQFNQSIFYSTFIISYLSILLFLVSKDLVLLVLGEKWDGSIVYLEILSFTGIFYSVNVLTTTLIKSLGYSKTFMKVEIIKKIIITIVMILTISISIKAMAFSLIFTGFLSYLLNSFFLSKHFEYNIADDFFKLLKLWGIFLFTGFITKIFLQYFLFESHIFNIIKIVLGFTFLIFLQSIVFYRKEISYLKKNISETYKF